jgi:hypothetical protein
MLDAWVTSEPSSMERRKMAPMTLTDKLHDLHDQYAWEVNAALERGESRLAERLSDRYEDKALELITAEMQSA